MEYVYFYGALLVCMLLFQTYRLIITILWWAKEDYYFQVFCNVVNHEMFWFNRLVSLLTIATLPLFILWNIMAVSGLLTALVFSVTLVVLAILWKGIRGTFKLVWKVLQPIFTYGFWLGRK